MLGSTGLCSFARQIGARRFGAISAVLITHSHWDHVGGHGYFRRLDPAPRFYASARSAEQLERQEGNGGPYQRWWGRRFRVGAVTDFRADVAIGEPTEVVFGGTRVSLVPSPGGETRDALLVHLPDESVLFGGDFIMPYLGAPHAEEGPRRRITPNQRERASVGTRSTRRGSSRAARRTLPR